MIFLSACLENKQVDGFVTIDVTANYPTKELILQDFMDVEYIPLETSDSILCTGSIWCVGEKLIVATNHTPDGNSIYRNI